MNVPASALTAAAATHTSSSVVISNLAYVVGALVLAIVITTVLAIRYRRPRTTEEDMDEFHRGLAALNPDRGSKSGSRRTATPLRTPNQSRTPNQRQTPNVRPQLRPRAYPVRADGSAPHRPSARSGSG